MDGKENVKEKTKFETTAEIKTKIKEQTSKDGIRKSVIDAITSIDNGPRVLKLYMEMCARCGTCADQCPVYQGEPTE